MCPVLLKAQYKMALWQKACKKYSNMDTCLPYLLIRVKLNKIKIRRSNLNQV